MIERHIMITEVNEAKSKGEREHRLAIFKAFLNGYTDEIPSEIIRPTKADGTKNENFNSYKCRKGFFLNIESFARSVIRKGFISNPEILQKCEEFFSFRLNTIKQKTDANRITAGEIQTANNFLKLIIEELSKPA